MSAIEDIRKYCAAWSDAYARGDIQAIADSYNDRTVFVTAGRPTIRGAAAIAQQFAGPTTDRVTYEPGEVLLEGGNLIVDVGQYVIRDEGGAEQRRGRYVAVFERQPNGELQIVVDAPLPD